MKVVLKNLFLLAFLVLSKTNLAQPAIIPRPLEIVMQSEGESFALTPQTVLVIEGSGLQPAADFLNEYLKELYGFTLKTSKFKDGKQSGKTSEQQVIIN